jgi:hypothetical protein
MEGDSGPANDRLVPTIGPANRDEYEVRKRLVERATGNVEAKYPS